MFSEGDIGVLPPLGVYDPLGLIETRDMRRYARWNTSALNEMNRSATSDYETVLRVNKYLIP